VLGVIGAIFTYLGIMEEDKDLIEKFGEEYIAYKKRVPGMNFVSGIIKLLRRRQN
jgi:protein-S-isoprenylcysteine O-methyltransferase Ste14